MIREKLNKARELLEKAAPSMLTEKNPLNDVPIGPRKRTHPVIILNGPPGVGKDTIARQLWSNYGFCDASFKTPMFEITRAILGEHDYSRFIIDYGDRSEKENPQPYLGGKSCREFFIWISETVIKPVFGSEYFGQRAREVTDALVGEDVVFADGGFAEELIPLLNSGRKVLVFQLHREGFSFDGDSRSFIDPCKVTEDGAHPMSDNFFVRSIQLRDGDVDAAVREILDITEALLSANK